MNVTTYGLRACILADVNAERDRQEELRRTGAFDFTCADRWEVSSGRMVNSADKLAVLAEEFGEVAREVNEGFRNKVDLHKLRAELIQVAAVAVAWVEDLDARGRP